MNWNEMKKKAIENGFVFVKHGSNHDIYENKANGKRILIERHWTQEEYLSGISNSSHQTT